MKTLADVFGVKIEKDMVKKRPMRVEDIDCSSRLEKYFKEYDGKVKHGNNKMREEFEKLPEIAELLIEAQFDEQTGEYVSYWSYKSGYLNGAWYSFQEQQKKIDKVFHYLDCASNPLDIEVDDIRSILK